MWYCVNGGSKRFLDFDRKLIKQIRDESVPAMIVITKVDKLAEDELADLKAEVRRNIPGINVFSYSTNKQFARDLKEAGLKEQYIEKDKMVNWALQTLPESLKEGFLPALKSSLTVRRNYILKNIVTKYSALAAGTVLAGAVMNVPFSDSVPLMGLQVKMAMSIIKDYGIKADAEKIIGQVVGTTGVSYLGKTLASQLVSVIPFIGNFVKATVNVSVAAFVTATLGASITLVCEQYLRACIKNNGAKNLPFADFFTIERLKQALSYVEQNKSEFNVADIAENAMNIAKK